MPDTVGKKIPITLIIVSLAALGGMVFAAKVIVGGFLHERVAYSSLRTQINDIEYRRDQLTLAQASAQNVDSDVSRIKKAFVDQNDLLNAVLPLEQEAARVDIGDYKVTVAQDISSSGLAGTDKKSSSILQGTTLRIEGRGTLEHIFVFMRTLQSLPYFLRIESLQIEQAASVSASQPSASPAAAPLQATIVVKFFSIP